MSSPRRSSAIEPAAPKRQVSKRSNGEDFANRQRVTSGVIWLIDPDYRRKLCCGIFLHFIPIEVRIDCRIERPEMLKSSVIVTYWTNFSGCFQTGLFSLSAGRPKNI